MPSCFGSLQIDRRSGTWKPASTGSSAGLGALEDLVDVGGGAADQVGRVEGVKSTRPPVYAIDQQAFAPLLVNRPALAEDLALSLSRRAQQVPTGAAQGPQPEWGVGAFLRAIQTIFHR
jgi:hypothetical protein